MDEIRERVTCGRGLKATPAARLIQGGAKLAVSGKWSAAECMN